MKAAATLAIIATISGATQAEAKGQRFFSNDDFRAPAFECDGDNAVFYKPNDDQSKDWEYKALVIPRSSVRQGRDGYWHFRLPDYYEAAALEAFSTSSIPSSRMGNYLTQFNRDIRGGTPLPFVTEGSPYFGYQMQYGIARPASTAELDYASQGAIVVRAGGPMGRPTAVGLSTCFGGRAPGFNQPTW